MRRISNVARLFAKHGFLSLSLTTETMRNLSGFCTCKSFRRPQRSFTSLCVYILGQSATKPRIPHGPGFQTSEDFPIFYTCSLTCKEYQCHLAIYWKRCPVDYWHSIKSVLRLPITHVSNFDFPEPRTFTSLLSSRVCYRCS